jgi:light-regulated signal transduction histidine kinase (bacteriophytochrome)
MTEPAGDLTTCDREPIHIPGAIQPHGVLLALDEPALTIAQVSENVGELAQVRTEDVLGRPLGDVLGEAAAEQVRAALAEERWDEVNPLRIVVSGRSFDGIIHRHAGVAILELEPAPAAATEPLGYRPLRLALGDVQHAVTLPQLCESVVREVRRLTGFERVMLYRFDEHGHGSVDAEDRAATLEPYLGLHYPASDIPQQARRLYLKNWLRIIPDARYTPVPIVPDRRPARRSISGSRFCGACRRSTSSTSRTSGSAPR